MEYVICKYGGVFLSEKSINVKAVKNVLRAVIIWFAVILLLTVMAALFTGKINVNEKSMAYISSALTFISSAVAGNILRRNTEKVTYCIIMSFLLIAVALSAGFLIDSSKIDSGGVLSVASFTLCGTLTGYIVTISKKKRSKIKL